LDSIFNRYQLSFEIKLHFAQRGLEAEIFLSNF
jgi:hypothetical protein